MDQKKYGDYNIEEKTRRRQISKKKNETYKKRGRQNVGLKLKTQKQE